MDDGHVQLHMSDPDAFIWYVGSDPALRSTIVAVLLLDRDPDWQRVVEAAERLSRTVPGFRHRVLEPPMRLATPRWIVDPDFDLSYHVRRIEVPRPKTLAEVLEFAQQSAMAALDRSRPLWEVTVVEGMDHGRAALVVKVHHVLSDGIGGMQALAQVFDFARDGAARGPLPAIPNGEALSTLDLVRDAVVYRATGLLDLTRRTLARAAAGTGHLVRHPVRTVHDGVENVRTAAAIASSGGPALSPVMTERHGWWHYEALEVSLDDLRHAADALDGTVNDAFLNALAGGLARYHEAVGTPVEHLRVGIPVSLRTPDDPVAGNRVNLLRIDAPVGVGDAKVRMAGLHELVDAGRAMLAHPLSYSLGGVLNMLPPAVAGGMLKTVDFLASNVPGIDVPLFVAGAEVERFYGFGPLMGSTLNVTLVSYRGTAFIGVNRDAAAIPDGRLMLTCLAEGFEEVLALGGDHRPVVFPVAAQPHPQP